jgi:hypothetical protein
MRPTNRKNVDVGQYSDLPSGPASTAGANQQSSHAAVSREVDAALKASSANSQTGNAFSPDDEKCSIKQQGQRLRNLSWVLLDLDLPIQLPVGIMATIK